MDHVEFLKNLKMESVYKTLLDVNNNLIRMVTKAKNNPELAIDLLKGYGAYDSLLCMSVNELYLEAFIDNEEKKTPQSLQRLDSMWGALVAAIAISHLAKLQHEAEVVNN